ncbi:formate dehydrogenase accessory sulfurtransferase FdhD [Tomitella fengzijianii]|uniref:Sulfur carrier protein FdhD n=1 Tax=Tomitella fengzijianii TaxID=2597660 RepID=A0A516X4S7_9ACTN|nr:formate dehydrogenase accessory sulfurtransferase FdhD [Tomitella fengzijianii]QDQ98054.1 formate dehydrogenase accessory sulfurtransferase FdhD [Tomitella fengzijianii]
MGRVTTRRRIVRRTSEGHHTRQDTLVVEEPLQIRVGGAALTVTMRTPGDDMDLVHGFLLAEGIVSEREHVHVMRYCAGADDDGRNSYNVLDVELGDEAAGVHRQRSFLTSSACGVCGTTSIDDVETVSAHPPSHDPVSVDAAVITRLPGLLRTGQKVFESTGGLHAAGLFGSDGALLSLREDVGRHNAVDKVLGAALRDGRIPLAGQVLMLSGRASFELVQKAAMAGVPVVAAVSAPSSLAVDLAERSGITLVGFVRDGGLNVYSRPDRVTGS